MRIPEVLFFYLLIGAVVGAYAHRQTGEVGVVSTLLWPLWLPALLAPTTARYETGRPTLVDAPAPLVRLEGLLLAWDQELGPVVATMRLGLADLQARQLALHQELCRPENDLDRLRERAHEPTAVGRVYRRRLSNVQAMASMHDTLDVEVRTALAQVEELCGRVQLARFSGATSDSVSAQLANLVDAIEGAREIEQLELDPERSAKLGL